MNKKLFIISWISFMAICANAVESHAADGKVLVVHSYNIEYQWVREINEAIARQFDQAGIPFRIFFMDTKRQTSEAYKQKAGKQAMRLVDEYRPQVIVAVDDNAQTYFAVNYIGRKDVQIVFCGVNADASRYNYLAANVTGILERPYPDQTLQLLKTMMPSISTVAMVCDRSPTADLLISEVKTRARDGQLPLIVAEFLQLTTFEQWQAAIKRLDQDTRFEALLIPHYHTLKVAGSIESMPPMQVMQWTVDNTAKPVVGLFFFNVQDGALLTVCVDPREHGRKAAIMAKQILAGKKAADIPMIINTEGYVLVNLKRAKKYHMDPAIDIERIADRVIR